MSQLYNQLKAFFDRDELTYKEVTDDMFLLGFSDEDGNPVQVQITTFEGDDYRCIRFDSRYVFNLSDVAAFTSREQLLQFAMCFNAYTRYGATQLIENDEICFSYTLMVGPEGLSEDQYFLQIETLLRYTWIIRNDLRMLIDPDEPELPPYMN